MGKLALLKAALAKGYLVLVILAVVNTAIAAYYYLGVIRETFFRDAEDRPLIPLSGTTRVLCLVLLVANVGLGILPGGVFGSISKSLTGVSGLDREQPALVSAGRAPWTEGLNLADEEESRLIE